MDPDASTIRRAQAGDAQAQADVLLSQAGPLRHLVVRMGERRDIDDQLQELYAKILAVLPSFQLEGPAKLGTWIFTVAHHWLIDRKRRFVPRLVSMDEAGQMASERPTPEQATASAETRVALEAAIAALPEAQRRIFVLAQIHGQPLDAIAAAEGLPIGTVKSRLHRARAELVVALGATLDDDERKSDAIGH